MRAEFFRPDEPDQIVAAATWDGRSVVIDEAGDPERVGLMGRIFRSTPVVVDDPAMRPVGTTGPVVLEPGDLRWFMAAARTRAVAEGLGVRLVVDDLRGMGWDPAGAYVPFLSTVASFDPAAARPDQDLTTG